MSLKTRGSDIVDKAQRRLALLKAIDENLDLGYGLTVEEYDRTIAAARAQLETYNTLLSDVQEARNAVAKMDKTLGELSERMLTGVLTKYGRHSVEYLKAGGSTRKRSSQSTTAKAEPATLMAAPASTPGESANGARNGQAPQPALS
jgi:hypothetical protein